MDEVAAGQVGAERHGDLVLPLPRVDGNEAVPVRIEAQLPKSCVAPVEVVTVELPTVVLVLLQSGHGGEVAEFTAGGEPHQTYRRGSLRGVAVSVGQPQSDAPVVGHEARVSLGHRGLDLLQVGAGQFLHGAGAVVQTERGGPEGRGDLLQIDADE